MLNLMPCVFPVLAMKAAGLAGLADAGRNAARAEAAAYTAGVLVAFVVLAAALSGAARRRQRRRLGLPVPVARLRRRHRPGCCSRSG